MTTVLRFALLASLLTVAACSRSGTTAAPPTASMTVTVAEAARRSVQR
jgi:predicted small lipoprotein YifL